MMTCGSILISEIFVISTKTFKITSRSKSRIYPLEQMSDYDSRRKCPNFKNIAECRNHSTKTPEDNTTHYTKTQILREDFGCAAYFIDFSMVYGVGCVVWCVLCGVVWTCHLGSCLYIRYIEGFYNSIDIQFDAYWPTKIKESVLTRGRLLTWIQLCRNLQIVVSSLGKLKLHSYSHSHS
jgi:hypothetical protein